MKTIFVNGHVTEIVGPGHHLTNFLTKTPDSQTYAFYHPMIGSGLKRSVLTKYTPKEKRIIKKYAKKKGFLKKLIYEFFLTIKHIWYLEKIDLFVGINNFDTLPAIFFKGWKIKRIVYYGSDYADERFENRLVNALYRLVEIVVIRFANLTVSNTKRAQKRRISMGLAKNRALVVPNGVDLSAVPKVKKQPKYKFVFQGHLSDAHGIMSVLEVFKKLNKKYKKESLCIIGYGPNEGKVKKFIKNNKLQSRIYFLGRKSHQETLKVLKRDCLVGIASYSRDEGWTKYASPLKVKEYLAAGLAVIISDVPEISETIKKDDLGFVYKNKNELENAMEAFMRDKKLSSRYSKNASKFASQFDWEKMYKEKLLPRLF